MSMPVTVTSRHDASTVAWRSRVPPASKVCTNVQLPSAFTGPTSPIPPPSWNRTVMPTSRTPWSGEPSARVSGHRPIDRKVAGTPSATDLGLAHFNFDGGVHTPVLLLQCAGLAQAAGLAT